jgi:hypothetical protein
MKKDVDFRYLDQQTTVKEVSVKIRNMDVILCKLLQICF